MNLLGPSLEDEEQALDDDILALADQIRRERTTKRERAEREKNQQAQGHFDGDNNASRQKAWRKEREPDDNPLVGKLIGVDHVNYVLMYNMLTGIRIAVSTYFEDGEYRRLWSPCRFLDAKENPSESSSRTTSRLPTNTPLICE